MKIKLLSHKIVEPKGVHVLSFSLYYGWENSMVNGKFQIQTGPGEKSARFIIDLTIPGIADATQNICRELNSIHFNGISAGEAVDLIIDIMQEKFNCPITIMSDNKQRGD